MHSTHAADLEGEGCPLAKEGDTLVQIIGTEAVLSRQHTQDPNPKVHAQTISAEPEVISGEPGAIKEVAHKHNGCAEPDLQEQPGDLNTNTPKGVAHPEPDSMPGEDIDPNANAPVHLEGTGPGVLMDAEEDRPEDMLEEDGITWENTSVEEDRVPCIELQESGVSHLAMPEEDMFLTSSSTSSPPTTSDTARTQRSLAVDTGTLAIPILDQGAVLEPPPHNMPVPNKGAESPDHHPSEQSQAPTKVGGPLESLPGDALQRAMGQMVPTLAQALEGKTPIGEAHGRPPDLPNLQMQGSTTWEPAFVVPKAHVCVHQAWRPVPNEGARTHPDLWPSPDIVIVNPDTCIRSASLLKGEQNIFSPCAGSEQYASPCTPQISLSSPSSFLPPDTLVRENPPGEGAATERRATEDLGPKHLKPPNLRVEDLTKSGGASPSDDSPVPFGSPGDPDSLGFAFTVANTDAKEVEPSCADVHERGGALPVAGAAPAPTESTTSVEPASKAEKAVAAKPEASVPWAQEKARRGREVDVPPREALPQKGERRPNKGSQREPIRPQGEAPRGDEGALEIPPRKRERRPNKGERERVRLQGEAPRGDEGALEMLPRTHEHEPNWPPREVSRKDTLPTWKASNAGRETETPLRKGKLEVGALPQECTNKGNCKPSWPSRETSHKAVPSTWEGVALWDPGGRPSRE